MASNFVAGLGVGYGHGQASETCQLKFPAGAGFSAIAIVGIIVEERGKGVE